jgi:hypothetical protein
VNDTFWLADGADLCGAEGISIGAPRVGFGGCGRKRSSTWLGSADGCATTGAQTAIASAPHKVGREIPESPMTFAPKRPAAPLIGRYLPISVMTFVVRLRNIKPTVHVFNQNDSKLTITARRKNNIDINSQLINRLPKN